MSADYTQLQGDEAEEEAAETTAMAPAPPAAAGGSALEGSAPLPNADVEAPAPGAGVGRHAVRDGEAPDGEKAAGTKEGVPKPCCARGRLCLVGLREYKLRGLRLPDFFAMVGSLVLPTSDAWLDWSVIIKWYLDGDVHWFEAGLAINLLSGALSGLMLATYLVWGEYFSNDCKGYAKAVAVGLLIGIPGLAPVAWAALTLYTNGRPLRNDEANNDAGPAILKWFKFMELAFEALPQSILQSYVGVAYGKFDPSSPSFSYLLPISVAVSLLGAGATAFSFEGVDGNRDSRGGLASRYGAVALPLRTAQVAALVFWIALLSCAEKGWAGIAIVLSVGLVVAMGIESLCRADKDDGFNQHTALGLCAAHLGLVGGMAAVFFGDEQAEGWAGAAVALVVFGIPMLLACGGCLLTAITEKDICSMICALVCAPLILTGMGYAFFTAEHMDNNYANKSMPMGGPGSGSGPDDPQYFDCHERTSGLYPAYLATALCVVLSPLYAALDPNYGIGWMRGQSQEEQNEELRAEVISKAGAVSPEEQAEALLEAKIEAVWRWADTVADGNLGTIELRRLASRAGAARTNDPTAEDQEKYEDMCEGLGLDASDGEVSIDRDAFTAACRAMPGATVEIWFDKLALLLHGGQEQRSCFATTCC